MEERVKLCIRPVNKSLISHVLGIQNVTNEITAGCGVRLQISIRV